MTVEEFDAKYAPYVVPGFEDQGLMIDDPLVTEYLDAEFTEEISVNPDFNFSQIKLKFGMARVYANSTKTSEWEEQIDSILALPPEEQT